LGGGQSGGSVPGVGKKYSLKSIGKGKSSLIKEKGSEKHERNGRGGGESPDEHKDKSDLGDKDNDSLIGEQSNGTNHQLGRELKRGGTGAMSLWLGGKGPQSPPP